MTQKQQQRLIGTLLLVFFIAVLAYIVLSKVSQTESDRQVPEDEPIQFSSVIEPVKDNDDDEAMEIDISSSEEAFVEIEPDVTGNSTSLPENFVTEPVQPEPETVAPEPAPVVPNSETTKAPEPKPEPVIPKADPAPKAPEPKPSPAPIENKPKPEPAPVPATTESSASAETASRWILQLGSFSVEANATSLKKQLEEIGYKPMIEQTRSAGNVIYRVRLQPNSDRATLEKTAESIRNKLNLNTQIFPYP